MYYKLVKYTPSEYGNDLQNEIAVSKHRDLLITHVCQITGLYNNMMEWQGDRMDLFESRFGYTARNRPRNEPYFTMEEVKEGVLLFDVRDV